MKDKNHSPFLLDIDISSLFSYHFDTHIMTHEKHV
jgi:hypothetical protein